MTIDLNTMPTRYYQIALTVIAILLFFAGKYIVRKIVKKHAGKMNIESNRVGFTLKFFNVLMIFLLLTVSAIIWDVSFRGLSIYFASLFAVIGVAFFAQWSMLSNITAAIILFFNYSYKIGNMIKVVDGDNSITGSIVDIQLFYFRIRTEDNHIVSYPNNLVLQKPIILLQNKKKSGRSNTEIEENK